jgi:uncharacterized protein (DUF58 family)
MDEPRNLHRSTTTVMSTILVLLGVAMIVRTLTAGGGGLAVGLLLGVLFIAAGLGRLYVQGLLGRRAGAGDGGGR